MIYDHCLRQLKVKTACVDLSVRHHQYASEICCQMTKIAKLHAYKCFMSKCAALLQRQGIQLYNFNLSPSDQ